MKNRIQILIQITWTSLSKGKGNVFHLNFFYLYELQINFFFYDYSLVFLW